MTMTANRDDDVDVDNDDNGNDKNADGNNGNGDGDGDAWWRRGHDHGCMGFNGALGLRHVRFPVYLAIWNGRKYPRLDLWSGFKR